MIATAASAGPAGCRPGPAGIVGVYAGIGALWSLASDLLLHRLAASPAQLGLLQAANDAGFVVLSAILLWLLLQRAYRGERALLSSIDEQAREYRALFDSNPHPMWVYDLDTLAFLAVNEAAVAHYGYAREEWARLTIADIRPPEDVPALLRSVAGVADGLDHAGVWRHRKKDGATIEVDITSGALTFHGRRAELVLAHDVTDQRAAQRKVAHAEERLRLALDAARQGLYDLDLGSGQVQTNDAYAEMLGYAAGELQETQGAWLARMHPDDRQRIERALAQYLHGKLPEFRAEFRQLTKQGEWKWILSLGRAMEHDAQGRPLRMLGVHSDIDADKRARARINRLTNLYAALSQCNEAIVRIEDRDELLRRICSVAVDFGGLRMAWIGEVRDQRVVPVASYGARTDYVAPLEIRLDPDTRTGRGPTATALREDRTVICDDIEGDPMMIPWRERALECGFRASAAVPLHCCGTAVGTLNLYAAEARFFDAELVGLIEELALDISFALDRIALRTARDAAEQRFRILLEQAADSILVTDLDGRIVDANAMACSSLGYGRDELLGMSVLAIDPEAARMGVDEVRRLHLAAIEHSQLFLGQHRRRDDSTFPVEVRLGGMRLPDGDYVVGVARDISERLRAEQALRDSERLFRHISRASTDIAYSCRKEAGGEFEIDWVIGAVERITGYTVEELLLRRCWRCLVVAEDMPVFLAQVVGLPAGSSGSCELRLRRKDGSIVWVGASTDCAADSDLPHGHRLYGGLVDISERKRAEEALRDSQALLEQAQRVARLGSWSYDLRSGREQWSDEMFRLLGHEPRSFAPHIDDFLRALEPEDRAFVLENTDAVVAGRGCDSHDVRVRLPDGSRRIFGTRLWVRRNADGAVLGLFGTLQDVTAQRQAEEALRESEARLRRVVDEMPVLFDAFDEQGQIIYWNAECERVTGYAATDIIGNPKAMDLLYPDAAYREQMLAAWQARGHEYRDWEWTLTARDGGIRQVAWYNISGKVPLPGWPAWGIGVDVTARREVEAKLARYADQLQALSRRLLSVQEEERRALARELHDEIGQQLAALKLNLTVLQRGAVATADRHRLADCVEIADLTIERIRDTALNLRPSMLDDLGLVSALYWYARRQSERAGCRIEVRADVPPLPSDIETAVFRIAQEAVNNALRHAGAGRIDIVVQMEDDWVSLQVADDGSGFDTEGRRASGAGLLSMRERAELLGGRFAMDSRRGAGTRVQASIPLELETT